MAHLLPTNKRKSFIGRNLMVLSILLYSGFHATFAISGTTRPMDITGLLATKVTNSTGSWNTASIWSPSGVPGSGDHVTVNHALTLDGSLSFSGSWVFNKSVTDAAGGSNHGLNMSNSASLEVKADATFGGGLNMSNSTTLIVRSGYTLIVGAASLSQSSSIEVERGASLIINGDVNASNSVPIVSDGLIQINGNFRSSNSVAITGTGDVFTTGLMVMQNSASVFGSTTDCNTGPCSGRNLCPFTNTLSTTTPTICTGTAPAYIKGVTNASSPTILWEKSITSAVAGFTTAAAPNTGADYTPGVLDTTTWYRKTVTKSGCTSKAVQQITVNQNPSITVNPKDSSICLGNNAKFSVTCTGTAPLTYKWQVYNGSTWSDISSSTVYSTHNTSTLTLTNPPVGLNTYKYRSIVSNSCTPNATSVAATLSVKSTGNWVGGSGKWSSASSWCGGLPTSAKDIVINSGAVTIDLTTAACSSITVTSPGSLILGGSNALSVYGNWTGNNNLTQTGGTITFAGTSPQSINGNNTFENLTIAKTGGSGISIPAGSNMQTIQGALVLTSGVLTTNGNLTIDFDNGGAIAGTGGGSIAGSVNTVRNIPSKWHYIGAPLDGLTYASINNSITITRSNFYTYQENLTSNNIQVGWISRREALTTPLRAQKDAGGASDMVGYGVNFPTAKKVTFTGTYNHTSSYNTGDLSYTSSGTGSSDGWHLISNPYPSYLDWTSAGITKTNISGPITFYDAAQGKNVDYIPADGIEPAYSINGGTQFIPPMQAFWVQSTSGNARVTVTNAARVINPVGASSFYRLGSNDSKSLKISVAGQTCTDETGIRFSSSATNDFDLGKDSYKFKNDAICPSIYTIDHQAEYSVNTLALPVQGKQIHLNFEPGTSGTFTLSLKDLMNIDASTVIVLEDKLLKVFHNLTQNPSYTFTSQVGSEAGRFILSFGNAQSMESIAGTNNTITGTEEEATGDASIDIVGHQHNVLIHFFNHSLDKAEVYIHDMAGHEIYSNNHASVTSGMIDIKLDHAHSGMYIVKVVTGHVSHSEKIHL